MNIILFGPPGAGKGTQASNIVKTYKLCKVSTGDLLREEIRKKTTIGKKIKSVIDKGELVSDEIINNIISKILLDKKYYDRIIFDGYPRNLEQAKKLDIMLKQNNQKISCVLSLEVDINSIVKRVLGRQVCSNCGLTFNEYFNKATSKNHDCDSKFLVKRADDTENTIKNRFDTYIEKTLPILNFYKEQKLLYEINGKSKIEDIFEEIRNIIASLET